MRIRSNWNKGRHGSKLRFFRGAVAFSLVLSTSIIAGSGWGSSQSFAQGGGLLVVEGNHSTGSNEAMRDVTRVNVLELLFQAGNANDEAGNNDPNEASGGANESDSGTGVGGSIGNGGVSDGISSSWFGPWQIGTQLEETGKQAEQAAVFAIEADWLEPGGIWFDANGELTVTDRASHQVEAWNSQGKLVWRTGKPTGLDAWNQPMGGYIDIEMDQALYDEPAGIVKDSSGIVYISDASNHTIRKIVNGVVYTFAGTGKAGYQDGSKKVAQFNYPSAMAIDAANNLYVADTMNHVIRKITPQGDVSTVGGRFAEEGGWADGDAAEARFNEPMGIALDDEGRIYVADSGNHLIRLIEDGEVSTYAGVRTERDEDTGYLAGGYYNGERSEAQFYFPKGLALTADGTLYVADSSNNRIRAVQPSGEVMNVLGQGTAGNRLGEREQVQLHHPVSLALSEGHLYVADAMNQRLLGVRIPAGGLTGIETEEDLIAGTPLLPDTEQHQLWLDGKQLQFSDAALPYYEGENWYVPIRSLFEQWGAELEWVEESFSIVIRKGQWERAFRLNEADTPIIGETGYMKQEALAALAGFRLIEVEGYEAWLVRTGE